MPEAIGEDIKEGRSGRGVRGERRGVSRLHEDKDRIAPRSQASAWDLKHCKLVWKMQMCETQSTVYGLQFTVHDPEGNLATDFSNPHSPIPAPIPLPSYSWIIVQWRVADLGEYHAGRRLYG